MPEKGKDILFAIKADSSTLVGELNKAKKKINELQAETKQSNSAIMSAFNWLKAGIAQMMGSMVIQVAKDFMNLAGQVDTVSKTFVKLASGAKNGSDGLLQAMQTATEGTVSTMDIMKSSNLAIQLMGEDVIKQLPEMAKIAKAAARAQGKDASQMLEDIVVASGRRSVMILDNLGISSATAAKYQEEYAKSLGKTRETLSDTQKSQAFFYAVMKAGGEVYDKAGSGALTFGEKLQVMNAKLQDTKSIIINELMPVFENFTDEMISSGGNTAGFTEGFTRQIAISMMRVKIQIKEVIASIKAFGYAAQALFSKDVMNAHHWEAAFKKIDDQSKGIARDYKVMFDMINGVVDESAKNLINKEKKKQADIQATKKEILKLSEYYKYLGQDLNVLTVKEGEYIKELQKKNIVSAKQIYEMKMAALEKYVEGHIAKQAELSEYTGDKDQAEINKEYLKYQEMLRIWGGNAEKKKQIEEEYAVRKQMQDIQSSEFGKRSVEGVRTYTKEALNNIDAANRQLVYNMMWGKGGWSEFKKSMKDIFKQLMADITYAIIRAAALQAILSATGLGGAGLVSRLIFEKGFIPAHAGGYMPSLPAYPSGYVPADHHLAYISDSEAIINKSSTAANYDALKWMNANPGQSLVSGGSHVANINVMLDGRVIGRAVDTYRDEVGRNSGLSNYGRKGAYKS